MTRDIQDRLALFGCKAVVERLALNMAQVEEYDPPPNPAKVTDSRYEGYEEIHGDESWELDALDPSVLSALVRERVEEIRDEDVWDESEAVDEGDRKKIGLVAARWGEVVDFVDDESEDDE